MHNRENVMYGIRGHRDQAICFSVFTTCTTSFFSVIAGGLAAAAVAVHRGVMVTGIAPAVMRLCLLRRVNASSATRLSLPLVGMEVPEPVMEVSVARYVCMYSL